MNPWLKVALLDEIRHFLSSSFAGLGAFFLTWITLQRFSWRVFLSRGKISLDKRAGRYMRFCAWSVGLFVSLCVHLMLDGLF